MLALKKKREAEKKRAEEEEAAASAAASTDAGTLQQPQGDAGVSEETKKVSLFGIGGEKKSKKGEMTTGAKKTPGELRIQKGAKGIKPQLIICTEVFILIALSSLTHTQHFSFLFLLVCLPAVRHWGTGWWKSCNRFLPQSERLDQFQCHRLSRHGILGRCHLRICLYNSTALSPFTAQGRMQD
jgi:hypothetical protein